MSKLFHRQPEKDFNRQFILLQKNLDELRFIEIDFAETLLGLQNLKNDKGQSFNLQKTYIHSFEKAYIYKNLERI